MTLKTPSRFPIFKYFLSLLLISIATVKLATLQIPAKNSQIFSDASQEESKYLPYDLEVSLKSPEIPETFFSIKYQINRDDYLYFYTDGLVDALEKINSTDFAQIFSDLDGTWWGIDLYDDELIEKFGENFIEFSRDFVESPSSFTENEDEYEIKITVTPSKNSYLPTEYSDISEFFVATFEG